MAEEIKNAGAAAESTAGAESTTGNEIGTDFSDEDFVSGLLGTDKGERLGETEATEEEETKSKETGEGEGKTTAESDEEAMTTFVEHGKTFAVPKKALEDFSKAVGITPDEVVDAYQKGRNYGVLKEKYDEAVAETQIFNELVEFAGVSKEELLTQIRERIESAPFEAKKEEFAKKYPQASPEMVENLAKAEIQNERNQKAKERAEFEKRENDAKATAKIREIDKFNEEHPELNGIVDPSVLEAFKNGIPLEAAYSVWRAKEDSRAEIARLTAELEKEKLETEKAKQEAFNRTHTPGGIAGSGEGETEDEFIKGLFREY